MMLNQLLEQENVGTTYARAGMAVCRIWSDQYTCITIVAKSIRKSVHICNILERPETRSMP